MTKSNNFYKIINKDSREAAEENKFTVTEISSSRYEAVYDYQKIKPKFTRSFLKQHLCPCAKYKWLLPVDSQDELPTLFEGNTPLYQSQRLYKSMGLGTLYFKHEGMNPTGSFKDRGSLIEVNPQGPRLKFPDYLNSPSLTIFL